MREIRFRAWDKRRKWMLYDGDSCGYVEFEKHDVDVVNLLLRGHNKNLTFLQFTGLRDKNGHEIYEGDIVEVYGHKDLIVGLGNHAYDTRDLLVGGLHREVYGFYIESKCGSWQCNISVVLDELKVIGNIYENPELLGDSN